MQTIDLRGVSCPTSSAEAGSALGEGYKLHGLKKADDRHILNIERYDE